jgi:hypothetical protein
MLVDVARRYSIGSVYANHLDGSNYKPLSTYLLALAQRICQLHTKFGLPLQDLHRPGLFGLTGARPGAVRRQERVRETLGARELPPESAADAGPFHRGSSALRRGSRRCG